VVVGEIGFAYYVALRFGLATLILLPPALARREQLRGNLRWGALLGALYFGGITLQGWGMEYTTASNAAFVTGLSVVIVFALEVALGREKPSARLAGAIALALTGLYLMSFSGGAYRAMLGDLIVLAGSFFWALQIIAVDRAARGDLYSLLFLESLFTALGASLVLPATRSPTIAEVAAALPPLAYLATVCTIGANALQLYGQRHVPSVEAALIYLLEPVFAAAFSHIALGEEMGLAQAVGAALILASMAVSSLRSLAAEKPLG
jgi:drug/metabolite transporter (DMT)-like permease